MDSARQSNREALSRLTRHMKPTDPNKLWMQIGSVYVKVSRQQAEDALKERQEILNREIYETHKRVTDNAINLEEMSDSQTITRHFGLKALSREEMDSFYPSRNI
ncbi:MAG: hypothetical protein EZS28_010780 [Streblomastix strix]|uniref:P53 and DNA damage-regulated protein 1 n=1 Tax=Streblomastix strix TaxID=222440 RepID=A0A5J4WG45_9EUKA|nr:MAG: hypothetical protein EZS28_010780 [Streblomastix strix]